MPMLLDDSSAPFAIDHGLLASAVSAVTGGELGQEAEVSVVVTDDAGIAQINEQYLAHEGPTDVISFPQYDLTPGAPTGLPPQALLGDVVISAETAASQAAEYAGWTAGDEVCLLLVHGLLHLCGYDDQTAADRLVMQQREDHYLRALGRPAVPREGER